MSGQESGPCRSCGCSVRSFYLGDNAIVSDGVREFTSTKNISEKRPWLFYLVWGVTLLSPFLGLVLLGWIGVGLGLLLGIACQIAGGYAKIYVREIKTWSNH